MNNVIEKDNDTIVIDTGAGTQTVESIETFDLIPETDPSLREVLPEFDFDNSPINTSDFASSMVETCRKFNGYGLSANQCGFPYRMFVMGAGDQYVAFFNPKVVKTEGEVHMQEACLSFPGLSLRITRPEKIWVEYQDFNGIKREAHYVGISARCFLHELDHMNGILYTEKAKPMALQSGLKKRTKVHKMMDRYFKNQAKKIDLMKKQESIARHAK
jgi:peptide deformylase